METRPKTKPWPYQQRVSDLVMAGKNVILQAPTGAGKTRAALEPFGRNLLGGPGRNWLRIHSTNISPMLAAMAPAECLSIAPTPNDSSPHTARNSPPPITMRSTS